MQRHQLALLIVCANCAATAPHPSLVRLDVEAPGATCVRGGVLVRSGVDANDNGQLDDAEIKDSRAVCNGTDGTTGSTGATGTTGANGADGATGKDGKDGTNGKDALLPVTNFRAVVASSTQVTLSWVNPPAPFAAVTIRRSTSDFPASPTDGTLAYEGTNATVSDTGLTPGTRYFYTAFAHDLTPTYTEPAQASAMPQASGALDLTFNGVGFVVGDAPRGNNQTQGTSVAVDSSNRVVVVGAAQSLNGSDAAVWRFNPDGSRDVSFAGNGTLVLDSIAGGFKGDFAGTVAIDASGRIYVGGNSYSGVASSLDAFLMRLLPDGTLDSTFANAGMLLLKDLTGAGSDDFITHLALDPAGAIIIAGGSGNSSAAPLSIFVAKLTTTGAFDTTFNTTGIKFIASLPSASSAYVSCAGVALDATGRIVVAGTGYNSTGAFDVGIWRFTSTGAPDTTFSGDGLYQGHQLLGGLVTQATSMHVAGNKVLFSGSGLNLSANNDTLLVRLNEDGTPDSTFGTNGVVTASGVAGGNGYDLAVNFTFDAQGRIVVSGNSANAAGNADAVIWRYLATGAPDLSFNGTGLRVVRNTAGGRGFDSGTGITLDSQGRIVMTGSSSWGGPAMVTWRFVP